MVKNALLKWIGRQNDRVPYGVQTESPNCTPVKFTPIVLDPEKIPVVSNKNLPHRSVSSAGFVQRVRNSFRFKKKFPRDYGLIENQASPLKPQFDASPDDQYQSSPSENTEPLNTSLTLDPLIPTSRDLSEIQDKDTFTPHGENVPSEPLIWFDHPQSGTPVRDTSSDLLLDAYFKTPDGIRKYHRRSKVLLSFRDDHLI